MPDTLTTVTHLINSPPGQLVAGGVLAAIVWKFFERVEAVLTDQTKLEIAVWLLGKKKLSPTFQNWPDTFAKVFDRVFGTKHLSWKCFWRSSVASAILAVVSTSLFYFGTAEFSVRFDFKHHLYQTWLSLLVAIIVGVFITDYISLLETRSFLTLMGKYNGTLLWLSLVLVDVVVTVALATCGLTFADFLFSVLIFGKRVTTPVSVSIAQVHFTSTPLRIVTNLLRIYLRRPDLALEEMWSHEFHCAFIAAFVSSIWLWLYAGSGFLLKAARRVDVGFEWFNRHFDIEKKPLQSIGLVAGALVAVVYWAAVIVSRVVR